MLGVRCQFKSEYPDLKLAMRRTLRQATQDISRNLNKELFQEKFIDVYEIAETFYGNGKSYTKMEFTFYPKKQITKEQAEEQLLQMQKSLVENVFVDNEYMSFQPNLITKRTYARKS